MKNYTTILGDLLSPLNRSDFREAVDRFKGDYRSRKFSTLDLFKTCVYGQVTGAAGLGEITESLSANGKRLYHAGLKEVPKSTLSDSLKNHDWRIFEQAFYKLACQARAMSGALKRKFNRALKIIDASTIELCLAQFDWAKFRTTKGAVKLHAKIDGDSLFPEQIIITNGNAHEVNAMNRLTREKGVINVFDRGYVDFKSLYDIQLHQSWFVTRMKKGCAHEAVEIFSQSDTDAIRFDASIKLTGIKTKALYPGKLRTVKYHDGERNIDYVFLTNNFELTAQQIADIYKTRWQIELFFKWLKQNLKVKTFWGTSKNAVFTQIWIALIVTLLLWIHRFLNAIEISAHKILQKLKTTLLARNTVISLCFPPPPDPPPPNEPCLEGLWS